MLGAAVADDVMGLVVLTVVVRLVTEGSVSVAVGRRHHRRRGGCSSSLGGLVGLRVAPPLFGAVDRVLAVHRHARRARAARSRWPSPSWPTLAKLAPIVGAFVAGIALSAARQSDRIRRELTPVGHLFIPVFFLQIGIDADIGAFGQRRGAPRRRPSCSSVAVVGKLVSPLGAIGAPGDKLLIGLGMLPRGEVGLIFATIGLQNGVLGDDLYAALLLVVLVTTLVTPQLLKIRYAQAARRRPARSATPRRHPAARRRLARGRPRRGRAGRPARRTSWSCPLALDAADPPRPPAARRPSSSTGWPTPSRAPCTWTPDAHRPSCSTSSSGATPARGASSRPPACSTRALPELAEALRRRAGDDVLARPARSSHSLQTHGAAPPARRGRPARRSRSARSSTSTASCSPPSSSRRSRTSPTSSATAGARRSLRLDLDRADAEPSSATLVARPRPPLVGRPPARRPRPRSAVLQLAAHLDTPEQARVALRAQRAPERGPGALGAASGCARSTSSSRRRWPTTTWPAARPARLAERAQGRGRRRCSPGEPGRARAARAARPRAYVLRTPSEALARHARLLDPPPARAAAGGGDAGRRGRLVGRRRVAGRPRAAWPPSPRCWPTVGLVGRRRGARHLARRRRARRLPRPARRPARRRRRWPRPSPTAARAADDVAGDPGRRGRASTRPPPRGTPCARCGAPTGPGCCTRSPPRSRPRGIEVRAAQVTRPRRPGDRPLRGHRPGRGQAQPTTTSSGSPSWSAPA